MPNEPKTPRRPLRISGADWDDLEAAAVRDGTNRSAVINLLVAWYLSRPGARLAKRPTVPPMPDTPERLELRARFVRISDADWDDLEVAAVRDGTNRSAVIKRLIAWYLSRPGANRLTPVGGGPVEVQTRSRSVGISDADWDALEVIAVQAGTSRSAVINELLAWYLSRPGAKTPKRPSPPFGVDA